MAFHHNNPHQLLVRSIRMGRDYLLLITGGAVHIGATAVSYWNGEEIRTETVTVPSHKEGGIACELAELACRRLGATVTVVAGIHIDAATTEEINDIVSTVQELFLEELDVLESKRDGKL